MERGERQRVNRKHDTSHGYSTEQAGSTTEGEFKLTPQSNSTHYRNSSRDNVSKM